MPEQKNPIKGEADEERNDVEGLKEHGPTSSSTVPWLKSAVNLCKIVHKAGVLWFMAMSGFSCSLFKLWKSLAEPGSWPAFPAVPADNSRGWGGR